MPILLQCHIESSVSLGTGPAYAAWSHLTLRVPLASLTIFPLPHCHSFFFPPLFPTNRVMMLWHCSWTQQLCVQPLSSLFLTKFLRVQGQGGPGRSGWAVDFVRILQSGQKDEVSTSPYNLPLRWDVSRGQVPDPSGVTLESKGLGRGLAKERDFLPFPESTSHLKLHGVASLKGFVIYHHPC